MIEIRNLSQRYGDKLAVRNMNLSAPAHIANYIGGHLKAPFNGKYINTKLQVGNSLCVRFAGLYLHQIIKEGDFNAYKKVNGAFKDKMLKSLQDINKIDNAKSRASASKIFLNWLKLKAIDLIDQLKKEYKLR